MRLIITRHGETEENKKGILQGHLPGKLSAKGIEQAKKLALRLKEEQIDAIYSSDLARASDTAKEIAKFHPNAKMFFVKELREKDQGELTGKNINDIDWTKPRNTEKKELMAGRAKEILDEVYELFADKTVLFVSHGGLIKILFSLILNQPLESVKRMEDLSNTSVSIFKIDKKKGNKKILMNCGKHL